MNNLSRHCQAAVIVIEEKETEALILTVRTHQLRNHPGEICFPGGRWDAKDATLKDTALRELQEELGIIPSRVHFQRPMNAEQTLSGYLIQPWFASIDRLLPYQLNTHEVAEVFRVPMVRVTDASNYQRQSVTHRGIPIDTYQFIEGNHLIWGATARIMMQLCNQDVSSSTFFASEK